MVPASGKIAPERTFISVLLPAPFSPTNASTSPGATDRCTPSRAIVPPKRTVTPSTCNRTASVINPPGDVRMQQLGNLRGLHIVASDNVRGNVDFSRHPGAGDVLDQCLYAEIRNAHRVLNNQRIYLPVRQRSVQFLGGVEADEMHFAGKVSVLQRTQHAEGGGLVRAENALNFEFSVRCLKRSKQVLAGLVSCFGCGAAVLILADHTNAGILLDGVQKTALTMVCAGVALDASQQGNVALPAQELAEMLAGHVAPLIIVRSDKAHQPIALQV